MAFLPEELAQQLNESQNQSPEMRLKLFKSLSEYVSLIPVRGGFPEANEKPGEFKAATEPQWQRWCTAKRLFNERDFSPDRAGLACGPASGVLVLDIDDWNRFETWKIATGKDFNHSTFTVRSSEKKGHFYFKLTSPNFLYQVKS
jgi:Bifunctional DNA primase/polymerase, N-terminal.